MGGGGGLDTPPCAEGCVPAPLVHLAGAAPMGTAIPGHLHPRNPPLAGSLETWRGDAASPMVFSCFFPSPGAGTREVLPYHGTDLVPLQGGEPQVVR